MATAKQPKAATPKAAAKQPKAAQAAKQPKAAQAAAPAPQTVALRGGPAVAQVQLTGKPYRSAAQHNTAWWATITQAAAAGPAPVANLLAAGVPAHFVGYTMRRGYLQAA